MTGEDSCGHPWEAQTGREGGTEGGDERMWRCGGQTEGNGGGREAENEGPE